MVVGDTVSGIAAAGTNITFQPAAGVEVMIGGVTSTLPNNFSFSLTNGAVVAYSGGTATINRGYTFKFFITNTIYTYLESGGNAHSFSGIQTK